jgi:predicted Ser/Thr protein kinase
MSEPLPRHVRGKRPGFHSDPSVDRLIAITLALASEVSVLRDRFDTLETLAQAAGWLAPGAVDAYVPTLSERETREARREAYLARVLHILREEIADLEGGETDEAYWRTIDQIERGEV